MMMDKLSRFWGHKNWKVRHGLLQFVAEAVCHTGEAVLVIPRDDSNWVLHKVIQLVGDPERCVLCAHKEQTSVKTHASIKLAQQHQAIKSCVALQSCCRAVAGGRTN